MNRAIFLLLMLVQAMWIAAGCKAEEYASDYKVTELVALTSGKGKNEDPCLLRAKDGAIYLTWFSDRGGNADIYLVSSTDAEKWTEPVAIIQSKDYGNFYPSLAQTADGAFHLTWFRIDPKRKVFSVWYANSKDTVKWSEPRAMTPLEKDYNWVPTIAASGQNVWIAWAGGRAGNKDVYVIESTDAGATWQEPVQVTKDPLHDDLPNIERKADGSLVLVWTRYKPGKEDYLSSTGDIHFATSKDGKVWSEPVAITQNDYTDTIPEIYSNLDQSEYFAAWCSAKGTMDLPLSDVKAPPKHLLASGKAGGYSPRLLPLTKDEYLIVCVKETSDGLQICSGRIRKTGN